GWALAAIGTPLLWPAPQDLILKFIAHHLWDVAAEAGSATVSAETETSSAAASAEVTAVVSASGMGATRRATRAHGMPRDVAETLRDQGLLRSKGPHAPATVE
ncbi:hypothetical protein C0081_20425, partial [Cohaesibacter celericrescens]